MAAFLRRYSDSGLLSNYVTQTSIAHLPREKFMEVPLPVPPPPEQRAIATALSDVDALLAGLDRLLAKKRDLKQAAMQQLLTGQTRLPGFKGKWEVKRLGDVATFYKGKGLPKSALSESGAAPCIHYGELFTRYPETIGEILSRTDTSEGMFRSVANDVLMPTSDVTPRGLAKASCVRIDGVILGGDILVIRLDANLVHGPFLSLVIRYEETQVLQLVTGSTVYHLYGSDMKNFTLSLPSKAEQTAIAEVLTDMDAELAALEQRREKTRALKQAMMQELLTGKTRLISRGVAEMKP
jgi:type I restriction enzyme S subunit